MVAVATRASTTTGCDRCHVLPRPPAETGTLYLAPPLAHTGGSLAGLLETLAIPFALPLPGVYAVELVPGRLAILAAACQTELSPVELAETRSLRVPHGGAPTLADMMTARSLNQLVAQVDGGWMVDLLQEERLTTHFQPIVLADAPTRVFGYECLTRGVTRDGGLIPPNRLFGAAGGAGLMFHLDRAARMGAIRAFGALGTGGQHHVFVNFNPTSIYDPTYCLRSTVATAKAAGIAPERIVFEVVESDEIHDTDHLAGILAFYRQSGFQVALDDLGAGYSSLNLLERLRPDFVKFDRELIRDVDQNPFKASLTAKLLQVAREHGIQTVAEGVETAGEWRWLRDHGADLVQGFLFARPGNPPLAPVAPESLPEPKAIG